MFVSVVTILLCLFLPFADMATPMEQDLSSAPLPRCITVLSLSGMGSPGYGEVCILQKLQERTGKSFKDMFDLVVGTSVGGVIGAILTQQALPCSPQKLLDNWGPLVQEIFHASWLHRLWTGFGVWGASILLERSAKVF